MASRGAYTHHGKATAAQQGHGAVAFALLHIVLCSEGKLGIQCNIMAALRGHRCRKLGPSSCCYSSSSYCAKVNSHKMWTSNTAQRMLQLVMQHSAALGKTVLFQPTCIHHGQAAAAD